MGLEQRSQIETMDRNAVHLKHVNNILQLDWLGSDAQTVLRTQRAKQGDDAKERSWFFHKSTYAS